MRTAFFQDYLDLFDDTGHLDCSCGRRHSLVTRRVSLARGALKDLKAQLKESAGGALRVWMLSDDNTRGAAGEACRDSLGGLCVGEVVLPRSPRPITTVELAERLTREAGVCRPELVLAVGAGTISDLGKMVSLSLDVPNWCVATAPSVDAYGSATAATKSAYRAKAVPCQPTTHILCDLDVLEQAPRTLFLSGLGDLLAKLLAYLDWNLSAMVTGEYYCPATAELALGSARRAIGAAALQDSDHPAAVRSLTDALVSSSFAMQAVGNSRPAATAEHSVGHFWEIAHCAGNPERELHGMLVGLASRLLLAGYGPFYQDLPGLGAAGRAIQARVEAIGGERSRTQELDPGMAPFRRWLAEESDAELYAPGTVTSHLERYREHLGEIKEIAQRILPELAAAVRVLDRAGYPFRLEDFGLGRHEALLPFRYVRSLRNRFSSFNLMYELGREGDAVRRIQQEIEALS